MSALGGIRPTPDPIAVTRQGRVSGERYGDGSVMRFRGIPYASPPVGALRWRPPQLPASWLGIRPANSFGPACPQPAMPQDSLVFGQEYIFSEDCLYLNVWTGSLDGAEKRPVIVWLHHGGFVAGWGGAPNYDGTGLAAAGAVLVTINYRLGRLGVLAHPALTAESGVGASGNYGLMDQLAALRWVQDNIAGFGGDPDCVTVYGISAGGVSASLLMTSPHSEGLFHRLICGSGGSFGPVSDSSMGGDFLQSLDAAEALGTTVMQELGAHDLDAMRSLSAERILHARDVKFLGAPSGFLDGAYPILDGHIVQSDPTTAYGLGRFRHIPVLTGSNSDERAITPFNPDTESYLADAASVFGPLFERFLTLFPAGPDGLTMRSSQEQQSDRLFAWQNWAFARQHAQQAATPVYYYQFAHEPPVPPDSVFDQQFSSKLGAFHSAELPYVFRNLGVRDWPWQEADQAMMETISGYWLDFARTGNPNGGSRPNWQPFDMAGRARMVFADGHAAADTVPDSARFTFFDEFYAYARRTGAVRLSAGASMQPA